MFHVFRRLCFLKLFILAVLGVQVTVFVAVCIVQQEWYISFMRDLIGISASNNDTTETFLSTYDDYCRHHLQPKVGNIAHLELTRHNGTSALCPCVPNTLNGRSNVTFEAPQIGELELAHRDLVAGGSWSPHHCIPRQRIALIIPFRDREEHLRMLLNIIHPMLQRQNLQYTIFVVEQHKPPVFNKASLMNVGFVESRAFADFDCFIFHDVDMLPEDDRNFYVCSPQPRHVGSHINKWNYELPYQELFGGVTAFRREHFEMTNGFSNEYYGWGGEDDDMFNRIKAQNLSVLRFSKEVARYSMVKHQSDVGNPYNTKSNVAWKLRPKHYMLDGLSSLRYRMVATARRPLYTWLLVSLPPHPPYFKGSYRGLTSGAMRWPSILDSVFLSILLACVSVLRSLRLVFGDV